MLKEEIILVADNYYANKKVIKPLIKKGLHLVSRLRNNAVAFYQAEQPLKKPVGRKKMYGRKVELVSFFRETHLFSSVCSPVYGEKNLIISYYCIDLLWRPVGQLIRFVLVNHPVRGKIVLMTTMLDLDPLKVISIYGYRFKIEVAFKQAVRTLGTYAYHFWMKAMSPLKRVSGNQHLHKTSKDYRRLVKRKIRAYHCYVQIGCIAQGLLLHLSINFGTLVWSSFRSWLRTMKKNLPPSEMVVSYALRSSLPEFLLGSKIDHPLEKFIADNADPDLMPDWKLYAA
ncbi:transposase DDE domain protein [bacterium BMS3Bbin08]|nr:transposase DDE domain protein [bacterium BMS3Bbin08]